MPPQTHSQPVKWARGTFYALTERLVSIRLKQIESVYDQSVPTTSHFVIRIDGVCFSTFTKGLHKPFDARLTHSMVKTAIDLVGRFQAVMGYHQSDEISLVFEAAQVVENEKEETSGEERRRKKPRSHPYAGRVQKLVSTTASYAAARLNHYLANCDWTDVSEAVRERMTSHSAYFDSRIVPCETETSLMETIYWRSNVDGVKNAVSMIANVHFKPKELHAKSTRQKIEMLVEKGIHVDKDFSLRMLFGTWVKKEEYQIHGMLHPQTNQPLPNPVTRSRFRIGSFNWNDWSQEDRIKFILAKFWLDEEGFPPMDPLSEHGTAADHSNVLQ